MTDETQKPKLTPELVAAGIAERCYSDSDFRQSFIDNPRACLEKACGKKLPEELEIVACENNDSKWYVPVPPDGAREISEEDMAKLAGGEMFVVGAMLVVSTTLGAIGIAAGLGIIALGGMGVYYALTGEGPLASA